MYCNTNTYNDTGIIIHKIKYSESKLIVHMITEKHGRTSYITTLTKKENTKNPRNLFQTLNVVNFSATENKNQNSIHKLTETTQYPLPNLTKTNTHKAIITMMISEVIYKLITFSEQSTYKFLLTVIQKLKTVENPTTIANFHLYFMVRLSQMLGYTPKNSGYTTGQYFDIKEAEFCSNQPKLHKNYFEPQYAQILHTLLNTTADKLHTIKLNRTQRKIFLNEIIQYYSYHSDTIHSVRSIEMFSDIF